MPKSKLVFTTTIESEDILQEFLDDVELAFGIGRGTGRIDEAQLDWPDLAVTYKKARKYLKDRNK